MRPDGTIETFPTFLYSESLASEIFVVIEDDDSMFTIVNVHNSHYLISNYFFLIIAVTIGFVNTSYTVGEASGMLQVDVQVFIPSDNRPLLTTFVHLVIQTVPGSASE